jgi:hypothetical protein
MLSADDIYQYLNGAWRLMRGKPDGVRLLDLSSDGFWNSFFAIVLAMPALILGWSGIASEFTSVEAGVSTFSVVLRLAIVDMGAWVLPLVALAVAAPYAGVSDRFVHYVVASNWGSALIAWMMLPVALLRFIMPSANDFLTLVSLFIFGLSMVFTWRLTNAVIAKGPAVGTTVFAGMFVVSLFVLFALQSLLWIQSAG